MLRRLFEIPLSDPDELRRGQTIVTVALALIVIIVVAIPATLTRADPLPSMVTLGFGVLIISGALGLARSGRVGLAGWGLVATTALAVIFPSLVRSDVSSSLFYLIVPVLIGGVVLRPWQIWLALALALLLLGADIARLPAELIGAAESITVLSNVVLVLFIVALISFIGARIAARAFHTAAAAQREAAAATRRLEDLNAGLEGEVAARTAELRRALAEVESRAAESQRLLDEVASQREAIQELSVPVLPVRDGTLVVPLVGALDTVRLGALQSRALSAIGQSRARTIIFDITGVPVVDTQVALGLVRTIGATRLLGAEPVLVGIRPEVAQTIVALGVDLGRVRTAADLASAVG